MSLGCRNGMAKMLAEHEVLPASHVAPAKDTASDGRVADVAEDRAPAM